MTVVLCDTAVVEVLALWRGGSPEGMITLLRENIAELLPGALQVGVEEDRVRRE